MTYYFLNLMTSHFVKCESIEAVLEELSWIDKDNYEYIEILTDVTCESPKEFLESIGYGDNSPFN